MSANNENMDANAEEIDIDEGDMQEEVDVVEEEFEIDGNELEGEFGETEEREDAGEGICVPGFVIQMLIYLLQNLKT